MTLKNRFHKRYADKNTTLCFLVSVEINKSTEFIFEPVYDKTYKMACAPSEDSDQTGHPPSLIRVLAVRMKKAWVLSYPLSAQ